MPSWIHEITVNFFSRYFGRLFDQALPKRVQKRIEICANFEIHGFTAEYEGSIKNPDIGIWMRNNNDTQNELKWTLEVGFSEKYDDLQEDVRLWLIGQPICSMAVLINITESPIYRCPLDFDLDLCDQLNIPQDKSQITEGDFSLQGEYGPVEFKGHQWRFGLAILELGNQGEQEEVECLLFLLQTCLFNFNWPTFSSLTILK
ncbi:hypothetical protein LTS15_010542 [Exophiala xenobiotica]|nr:hypothetical protein LTS15_010542 [Exophiala xenobiotica]